MPQKLLSLLKLSFSLIITIILLGIGSANSSNQFDWNISSPIGEGGTIVEDGDFIIHIFSDTGADTFTPPDGVTEVEVLVVAGGGGGGSAEGFGTAGAGGGGAGGLLFVDNFSVSGPVSLTVGTGGTGGSGGNDSGTNGEDSEFGTLAAIGGGGGIGGNGQGNAGGSGGGSRGNSGGEALQTGPDGFGNSGGDSGASPGGAGGTGGGGAGTPGANLDGDTTEGGGNGGAGLSFDISGTPTFYAGGGGGGASETNSPVGSGGNGGGGNGANDNVAATAGEPNTGGGGGGGNNDRVGADGGSGIIIVRYEKPFIEISNATELNNIRNDLSESYVLVSDIDLSSFTGGNGWEPIGTSGSPFTGTIDGNGFTISNLTIDRNAQDQALFGVTSGSAVIENIILEEVSITSGPLQRAGALVGDNNGSIQFSAVISGNIEGVNVGGLVGRNQSSGTIEESYSNANVIGERAGGLVGRNAGTILNSYATGNVDGDDRDANVANNPLGGLVGLNDGGATVENSWSAGLVFSGVNEGGLVGLNSGSVIDSYWDSETSAQSESPGSPSSNGLSSFDMTLQGSFSGFNFGSIWNIENNVTYPYLLNNTQDPLPTPDLQSTTYYTYQNGSWNNPTTWTTDPSGALIIDQAVPDDGDAVVVLNGRTVTVTDDIEERALSVRVNEGGTLNMNGFEFTQTLFEFAGRGTFRVQNSYFPEAVSTPFTGDTGGTYEITGGGGVTLPSNLTQVRNLRINVSTSTANVTALNDLTVLDDLRVTRGTLRINDNSATDPISITIARDLIVGNNGRIRVGTPNVTHNIFISRDLRVTSGDASFTNSGSPNYSSDPTQGVANVHMIGEQDGEIVANGNMTFNRLIINKGNDQTFRVIARSNNANNFRLFGRINQANGSTSGEFTPQNPEINKALWIRNGTLEFRSQINIEALSEGGNDFFIPENGRMVVNGATINSTTVGGGSGNTGLTLYGTIQMISGIYRGNKSAGIVYRDSGEIFMEGGTMTVSQVRQSVTGSGDNFASYIQTGGTFIVNRSGENNGGNARFSMDQVENIFRMEGGTLRVQNDSGGGNGGGITILSSDQNINVTGGTVEVIPQGGNNPFRINSTAPFHNLIVQNGNRNVRLDNDLIVLNDATFNERTTDFNSFELSVGRNLFISENAQLTATTSGIRFFGNQDSELIVEDENYVLDVGSLTVEKSSTDREVLLVSPRSDSWDETTDTWNEPNEVLIIVRDQLTHQLGLLNNDFFTIRALGNVTIADRIGVTGQTKGRLYLDGTETQNINVPVTSQVAQINLMQLNNADGATLSGGNLNIDEGLLMETGIFDIGTSRLTLNFPYKIWGSWEGDFGPDKMIQTAGNNSDGGLEMFILGNTLEYSQGDTPPTLPVRFFPLGVDGKYTPVEVDVTNNEDDEGYIRINPVDQELSTLASEPPGEALEYYWRVRNRDFESLPDVTFEFTYDDADVPGSDDPETDYVPGRVIEDLREFYSSGSILDNVITYPQIQLQAGSYTAASEAKFTGSVTVFYSRESFGSFGSQNILDWTDGDTWSLDGHDGPPAGEFPSAGDIARIGHDPETNGDPHFVQINDNVAASNVIFTERPDGANLDARLIIAASATNVSINNYSGNGTILVDINNDTPSLTGDFGDFSNEAGSNFLYRRVGAGSTIVDIPANPVVYPNLRFVAPGSPGNLRFPDSDLVINGNLWVSERSLVYLSDTENGDLQILGNLQLGQQNNANARGTLVFRGGDFPREITVNGDLQVYRQSVLEVEAEILDGTHTLILNNDILQENADSRISLHSADNSVDLVLTSSGENSFSRSGGEIPAFHRIILDKGSDTSSSFLFDTDFTLGADNDGDSNEKPLVLRKGRLILNDANLDLTLSSGGGDFLIPSSTGIDLMEGTLRVNGPENGILLDGELRLFGSSSLIVEDDGEDNYIEYSGSANAVLEISDDAELIVGSQVRRSLITSAGAIKYRQSGGNVKIATQRAPVNSRGVFEVLNPDSEFNFTGGTFTMVRGHEAASSSFAALFLEPASSVLAPGSIIEIGNDDTPADEVIDITSAIPFRNLSVNAETARLRVRPLVLQEDLTVSEDSEFDSNSLNVTVAGDVFLEGSFNSGMNTVTLNGTEDQSLNLSTNLDLNNFHIDISSSKVTVNGDRTINVGGNFQFLGGELDDNGSVIRIAGNITHSGTHIGSGRIEFNGDETQELNGDDSGIFENLRVNNEAGIISETDLRLNGNLNLVAGVFIAGGNLVEFGPAATTSGSFDNETMIRTNGSLGDKGVRKLFTSGVESFLFPIGSENKYRPVEYEVTQNTAAGQISVKPINIAHPSVTGDGVNRLRFYWIVNSSGFDNLEITHSYGYDDVDIIGDDNTFRAGRFLNGVWIPQEGIENAVIPATNSIIIEDVDYVVGDYTAGEPNEFGVLQTYVSRASGDFQTAANWYLNEAGGDIAPTPPNGNAIVIQEIHDIVLDDNSQFTADLTINGTLDIGDSSGHIFGNVFGTGTLIIRREDVIFPAGDFSGFLGEGGGTIRYEFDGEFTLPTIDTYNSLVLSGNNTKTLPATDITVLKDFEIQNGNLNLNNRTISVRGDFINNTGVVDAIDASGGGAIRMNSSQPQSIRGVSDIRFCDLIVDNDQNVSMDTDVFIDCTVFFERGQLLTTNQTLVLDSEIAQINEKSDSYAVGTIRVSPRSPLLGGQNFGNVGFSVSGGSEELEDVIIERFSDTRTVFGTESINRVWDVSTTGPQPTNGRSVTLSWFENEDNGVELNSVGIFRNTGSEWVGLGGTRTERSITASTNSFSEWTVVDESALPVELEYFAISTDSDMPKLEWATATEYENYGYYVERKYVGFNNENNDDNWVEIAFVEGQGTKRTRTEYSYIDDSIEKSGQYFYRITQMDYDGQTETFDSVEFFQDTPQEFSLLPNYPNPFNPITTIPFKIASESNVSIIVYDILGRRIQTLVNETVVPGTYTVQFDGSRFASGVYLVRMVADGRQHVTKMMLIK